MEELIKVNNLTKVYGDNKAVDNASFVIEKGKIYGLLGPNGAGKTTIMKLLTNLIKKDSGSVEYDDSVSIKYLMDVPVFYEYMKVSEFLNMLVEINKVDNRQERLDYLLELSGLTYHKDKLIKNLSRGLRQKLGLASVLVSDVDVLILDEPISALDPIGRKETLDMIESLRGKVSVIFSSHILDDIEKVCDHVLLINKGKIILNEECNNLFDAGNFLLVQCASREEVLKLKEVYPDTSFSKYYENTLEIEYESLIKAQTDILKNAKKMDISVIKLEIKKETLEDIFLRKVMGNE